MPLDKERLKEGERLRDAIKVLRGKPAFDVKQAEAEQALESLVRIEAALVVEQERAEQWKALAAAKDDQLWRLEQRVKRLDAAQAVVEAARGEHGFHLREECEVCTALDAFDALSGASTEEERCSAG